MKAHVIVHEIVRHHPGYILEVQTRNRIEVHTQ